MKSAKIYSFSPREKYIWEYSNNTFVVSLLQYNYLFTNFRFLKLLKNPKYFLHCYNTNKRYNERCKNIDFATHYFIPSLSTEKGVHSACVDNEDTAQKGSLRAPLRCGGWGIQSARVRCVIKYSVHPSNTTILCALMCLLWVKNSNPIFLNSNLTLMSSNLK